MNNLNRRPKKPADIGTDYGVSIDNQVEYNISLTKATAFEFLIAYGKKIKESTFKKNFSRNSYDVFFGRPVVIYNKKLVFTYAEVLHMADHEFQLPFPEELKPFLI